MSKADFITKDFIEDEMKFWLVPGMAVSVFKDGEVLLSEGYGYKDVESKSPVTSKTQFGIASCSKSFTSTIIAMLVDEGILDYDKPIREFIPEFRMYDEAATEQICLRDMLCHRTGLAAHDALWVDTITRADLFHRLRYLKPSAPIRTVTQYNNTIYTLIGHIAEKVTGKTWEELVYERIFKPLGMTNSNCSVEDMKKSSDFATPYWDYDGEVKRVENWNVDLGAPAAGINSCVEDMAKWVDFHINNGKVNGNRLVSEQNMREMHTSQSTFLAWPWNFKEVLPVASYGMAWFIDQYRGYNLVFHTGEIEGYCSIEAFIPSEKLGVVMLMNLHKPCVPIINTLLYTIFDSILGLTPIDWSARFRSEKGKFGLMYYHWDCNLLSDPPVAGTKLAHEPADYVGKYFNAGYGDFQVLYDGEGFSAIYRGVKQPMEHYHYETMKVPNIKQDTILITAPLTFITDPYTGKVNSLKIDLEPTVDPIVFDRV